jgi:hypothetical protein
MHAEPLLGALFGLALLAFAGRVLLAWLPPGEPGWHRPAELPTTWAASHLLGWIAFQTECRVARELGLSFSWPGFLLPFALLALLRLAALPGAMVPRHGVRRPRETPLSRALLAALVLGLAAVALEALRSGEHALASGRRELSVWRAARPFESYVLGLADPAERAALALLVLHGLSAIPVRPVAARLGALAVLLAASTPAARAAAESHPGLALGFGAGVASGAAWFARADPRALALASLSFGACLAAAPSGAPFGIAGLAALALALHPNARKRALPWALVALLVVGLPWQLARSALELANGGLRGLALPLAEPARALLDWRSAGPLWLLVPPAIWIAWRRARPDDRRGERFLVSVALLAALLQAPLVALRECLPELDGASWPQFFRWAAPAAVALLTLASGRPSEAG